MGKARVHFAKVLPADMPFKLDKRFALCGSRVRNIKGPICTAEFEEVTCKRCLVKLGYVKKEGGKKTR